MNSLLLKCTQMNKVVYNACYGGFTLSLKAIDWLESNCIDENLREHIKMAKVKSLSSTSTLNDDFLRYTVSDWFCDRRHHKDLVAVVETLGEEANGPCAKLAIENIDSKQYHIKEYDGIEDVVTPEDNYRWIVID